MADVARQAGLHTSTISLALRNHPSIPESTRQRIRALADRIGYRPDPALSSLMALRRRARSPAEVPPLAYLTHWGTQWGWKRARAHGDFHAAAEAKARQLGYRLEHFWLGEPNLSHHRMSEILLARGIHGVVVASHLPENDVPLSLNWTKFSAVKIDYFPHEPELHLVTNDQRAIMRLVVQRVMQAGYRRIGFVIPRWWDEFADRSWSAGFLAEQQVLDARDWIPILFFSEPPPGGRSTLENREMIVPLRDMQRWIRRYRPEVIVSNEEFVMSRLEELGLHVPRDIAYAEIFLSAIGTTAGVRHNCQRVGELAVEILAGQLQQNLYGIPAFPTATLVEGTWFDGASLPRMQAAVAAKGARSNHDRQ